MNNIKYSNGHHVVTEGKVIASGTASIEAWNNAKVKAYDKAKVFAHDDVVVDVYDDAIAKHIEN